MTDLCTINLLRQLIFKSICGCVFLFW